ncbi:MAG TPA: redoxin family protein [Bryobacterales bacterium]|nr:redoxin family protein [Bryobacterales bacterium]
MRRLLIAALLGCLVLAAREGRDLIGTPAPPLHLQHWLNSPPLEIASLRGKVVLLRWWTDTCSLCAATAPALREMEQKYGPRGFVVIGVFHPKAAGDRSLDRARRAAQQLGFTFPVALDADWSALRRWWLDAGERDYTSVSFLVDKRGVIRYVQPGGEYHQLAAGQDAAEHQACQRDYKEIDAAISRFLAE